MTAKGRKRVVLRTMFSCAVSTSAALLLLTAYHVEALEDGLARRPPMGWRSWEAFYVDVDEAKVMTTMDALVDRSRWTDSYGVACAVGSRGCTPTSLADLGFNDVGLDEGFEDCASRRVGGKPAFHDASGRPMVDRAKFPSGLGSLVAYGHRLNLTVSWYGNACACESENSYTNETQPTIAQAIAGTVAATVEYEFDGLKLDSCSQFNNMTLWAALLNATGRRVLIENCHQGGLVPGQRIPGQDCEGTVDSPCPYHVFRTSDDSYNHWANIVNNINSVTPYLSQADPSVAPRSRPGQWAYPDMLEVGNLGCKDQASGCVQKTPPSEDRSQFGMWAIVSAPLVLSVDLASEAMLDRIWPILSNKEAIRVNQHWSGSPGRLLLTDRVAFPSRGSCIGQYHEYAAKLGQSRGWQNVPGMTAPPPWQVGECVDEWTGGPCTRHYMTMGGGPRNITLEAATGWCNAHVNCHGFTFPASTSLESDSARTVYFRDETQIFFMDSELGSLTDGTKSKYASCVKEEVAPPLPTSGVQIWVKDVSTSAEDSALALLMVNVGASALNYSLPFSKLPAELQQHEQLWIRDIWAHRSLTDAVGPGQAIQFKEVKAHDSVFYILRSSQHNRG